MRGGPPPDPMSDSRRQTDPSTTEPDRDTREPSGTARGGGVHVEELARTATEFEVLQRVSSEINSTLDLEEIYDIVLRTMDELFEFHHANILLVEPGGETLAVVASRGYENQAVGGRVRIGIGAKPRRGPPARRESRGPRAAFSAAHIPGSINIPFGPTLPTWAGWVLPYDRPTLLIVDDPARMSEVTNRALSVTAQGGQRRCV